MFLKAEASQFTSWPLDRIPSFVPEYLEPAKRIRLELLKRAYLEPFRRRTRAGIRIARYVGAVAGKSGNLRRLPLQRNVVRVEYRERRATHRSHNSVQLPIAENMPIPAAGVLQERKDPLVAQYEAMAGIEHGAAAIRREIKWILRKVIFSGDRLRRRAGNVEGRNVINGVRPSIGRKEGQAVACLLYTSRCV